MFKAYNSAQRAELLKIDGVAPIDNRPSTNKDGGLKHLWTLYSFFALLKCPRSQRPISVDTDNFPSQPFEKTKFQTNV
jgi:hypothetical protein